MSLSMVMVVRRDHIQRVVEGQQVNDPIGLICDVVESQQHVVTKVASREVLEDVLLSLFPFLFSHLMHVLKRDHDNAMVVQQRQLESVQIVREYI